MKSKYITYGIFLSASVLVFFTQKNASADNEVKQAAVLNFRKIDRVIGNGNLALSGKKITVHYTGWLYAPNAIHQHGMQFDSSRNIPPFTFVLDRGKVIPGWDKGLVGMKVGGKRTLIVPAELGYGTRGAGPVPPNANLIFDVELLDVQ